MQCVRRERQIFPFMLNRRRYRRLFGFFFGNLIKQLDRRTRI
jgi:hypothetical protein